MPGMNSLYRKPLNRKLFNRKPLNGKLDNHNNSTIMLVCQPPGVADLYSFNWAIASVLCFDPDPDPDGSMIGSGAEILLFGFFVRQVNYIEHTPSVLNSVKPRLFL